MGIHWSVYLPPFFVPTNALNRKHLAHGSYITINAIALLVSGEGHNGTKNRAL